MCVGFWSLEHPDYALILCTNRDEYLSRPTSSAHWHSFEKTKAPVEGRDGGAERVRVLSGRDLRAGGTWLGINEHGNIAFLTNITEEIRPYSSSRGDLTSSFLLSDVQSHDLQSYLDSVTARNTQYAGFNLLLLSPSVSSSGGGDAEARSTEPTERARDDNHHQTSTLSRGTWTYAAAYLTNHGGGGALTSRLLTDAERRSGALSNGIDGQGADAWPKVIQGSRLFLDLLGHIPTQTKPPGSGHDQPAVQDSEPDLVERLFTLLTWKSENPPRVRGELRNTIQIDPLRISLAANTSTLTNDRAAGSSSPTVSETAGDTDTAEKGTKTDYYGTRLSTVILVRRDGSVLFVERDIWTLPDSEGARDNEEPTKCDPSTRDRTFRFHLAERTK